LVSAGLAVLPGLVVGLAMLAQLGSARFFDLLRRGGHLWPAVIRPLAASGGLLALFAWLILTLPNSPLLQRRTMRLKRALAAVGCLLLSATLWAGIILGDVGWRTALVEVEPSPALSTPLWAYLLIMIVSAALLYALLRPRRAGGR
jgi:hypothetical protein